MEMFLAGTQMVFGSGVETFPGGIQLEGQECEGVAGGLGTAPQLSGRSLEKKPVSWGLGWALVHPRL